MLFRSDVTAVIHAAGYLVRYLPPYSPDYTPIELTFGVLKAWIQRNYIYMRHHYRKGDFAGFLRDAITQSKCDRFARKHFKYAAGGLYIEQEVLERAKAEIRELKRVSDFEFDD